MFFEFERIKRKSRKWLHSRLTFLRGGFHALGMMLTGRLTEFTEELKRRTETLKEIESELAGDQQARDTRVLFVLIGRALTIWATMEESLVCILSILLRTDLEKAGLILYSTINFNVWLSIIDELFAIDEQFKGLKPRWNKLAARLREVKDRRDSLAHHPVSKSNDQGTFSETLLKPPSMDIRRKSLKYKPMAIDDIFHFAVTIANISTDLTALAKEMMEQLRSSLEKSSE